MAVTKAESEDWARRSRRVGLGLGHWQNVDSAGPGPTRSLNRSDTLHLRLDRKQYGSSMKRSESMQSSGMQPRRPESVGRPGHSNPVCPWSGPGGAAAGDFHPPEWRNLKTHNDCSKMRKRLAQRSRTTVPRITAPRFLISRARSDFMDKPMHDYRH
jgi:hypothetical protein